MSKERIAQIVGECYQYAQTNGIDLENSIKAVAMRRQLKEETVKRYIREMETKAVVVKGREERKETERWLVISDLHAPFHDKKAVECMVDYAQDYKPHGIIIDGDLGDMQSCSHWLVNKRLTLEGKRIKADIDICRDVAENIAGRLPSLEKKVYLLGNHEAWLLQYLEAHPELEGLLDLEGVMENEGWEVYPENTRYRLGHLRILHGLYVNKHHAAKTLDALGVSALYGHTHDHQAFTVSHDDGEKSAMSIGCLCDMNPAYMKNRPKRWVHGFATVDMIPKTGEFFTDFVKIINGKTARNGVVYGK